MNTTGWPLSGNFWEVQESASPKLKGQDRGERRGERLEEKVGRLAAESFGQDCGCIVSGRRAGGQIEFTSSPVMEAH